MNEIVPGLFIFCTFSMIFGGTLGFFAYLRYMRYKETIELADKGLVHPRYERNGKSTLRWGIAITGLGIALCLGLYPFGWLAASGQFPLNFGPWMLVGLVPAFFGLSLIVIYLVTRERGSDLSADQVSIIDEAPLDESGVVEEDNIV